jgi:hypothetical protein
VEDANLSQYNVPLHRSKTNNDGKNGSKIETLPEQTAQEEFITKVNGTLGSQESYTEETWMSGGLSNLETIQEESSTISETSEIDQESLSGSQTPNFEE